MLLYVFITSEQSAHGEIEEIVGIYTDKAVPVQMLSDELSRPYGHKKWPNADLNCYEVEADKPFVYDKNIF